MTKQFAPEKCDITPKQKRAWIETRTKLLYDAPMFSHLLYTMMTKDENIAYFTRDERIKGTAATDDSSLFINPDGFFDRPLPHRVFISAHEVVHAMLGHTTQAHKLQARGEIRYPDGTVLPFNDEIMARAQDYFVNALLIESKIGQQPPDTLYDPRFSTKVPVLDAFRILYEEQQQDDGGGQGQGDGDGQGEGGSNFDAHLPPGIGDDKSPTQAVQDRNEDKWQREIEAAMQAAQARGQLPDNLKAMLGEFLEPQVSWQEQIVALFARKLGVGSYDWRRPDRRMISRLTDPVFSPARSGHGCRLIVVVGDSSGSIGNKTAAHFFGEMSGILEDLSPELVKFVWCDARTHGWEDIEDTDDLARVHRDGLKGGGGTSFIPPFRDLAEMGLVPDAVVYLTDGDGTFPENPGYPVIWGDITNTPSKYPFGDVVHIPVQR